MLLEIERAAVSGRLSPFSACVSAGERIHLLGPNGAGKSSLLARLSGLLPGVGRVQFLGQPLENWSGKQLARLRAWLPQQQPPLGQMAVFHYLQLHLVDEAPQDESTLQTILHCLQLKDKLSRRLTHLSGGEWQRVRLAAALLQIGSGPVAKGKLLLLDEPMSGLDVAQQAAVDDLLAPLSANGVAVIMSGHDLNHSLHQAQRVWLMKAGQVVAQGAVEEVMQPELLQQVYEVPFRKLCVEGHNMLTVWR
ncbi:Vitamin B12 import ATP-binding protein BtuD [Paramixta manurensis]|uniref:Vitamin B12 import ATP-binding protein BtuD n=1 Tax=Paramixta manurensis TaxID=2740817 RepID=A0A6M8UNY4_9GAMM|nr:Vitamin B12 import ATP-binding protein BtuD [Erwiniaceae bacterium PD-1]